MVDFLSGTLAGYLRTGAAQNSMAVTTGRKSAMISERGKVFHRLNAQKSLTAKNNGG
jgi:hypothetical protein